MAKLLSSLDQIQVNNLTLTKIINTLNVGIGYETALDFAKRGAKVILACRDTNKAEAARYKIIEETGNEQILVKMLDLSSFKSVRTFAEDITKTEEHLDILVNNAGAVGIEDEKSEDGHLLLMQINYYSHFLLTNLLIDLLKKSTPSRIVNVSSSAAKYPKNFNKYTEFQGIYGTYSNSKLCQILFTKELSKKLQGTGITVYSLHPGVIKTEIHRNSKKLWQKIGVYLLENTYFKVDVLEKF